ncbi:MULTISPECIES: FAD-dependent 5-carboxymethylaminomethyl-2-thiouridine(34) oxidoreductase MnmC [unclassified Acinetobacter]|uniref:FAD-dependent 5-carboxymethylaminomethyl-2-thiouridine(34) oxidoreductase MnmC n=1 Tax=unclassified Acinetobacter TaxID=196816 RepID=UPI0035BAABB3
MQNIQKIDTAELEWQHVDGVDIPISKQFGDVYFSKANGLLETRHVFLNGNDLAERLSQLDDFEYFSIGETGFGTGLNFLALWQLWQQVRPNNHSHLHFITVEKYPLHIDDLKRALAVWTELADLSAQLIECYPLPIAGCHRIHFAKERISLDLWLGDAVDIFPKIYTNHPVDAWFLDGFAPSCNADFWQDNILKHIIRLSAVGTTFASFTVAGVVKRGLAQYGIQISRPKGFGHKREMLKAVWQDKPQDIDLNQDKNSSAYQNPVLRQAQHERKDLKIAIIGAGIAGLSCAWGLAQRGYHVEIFDKNAPVSGASGNPLALLNPKLCPIEQSSEHLMLNSWQYAVRHYRQFTAFRSLTVQQLQLKAENELDYIQQYPQDLLSDENIYPQWNSTFPQLNLTQAGGVEPKMLAEEILAHPLIDYHQLDVENITTLQDGKVILNHNEQLTYDKIILCTAKQTADLVSPFPPLKAIRGQVSWCDVRLIEQKHAYSYSGYLTQVNDHQLVLGASFHPNRDDDDVLFADHQHNFDLVQQALPKLTEQLPDIEQWQGRASIRTQTADYFPIVGKVAQGEIYALTGLGSKGFLFAPLCVEVLLAEMLGESSPVPYSLWQKLRPQRFRKTYHS